MDPLNERLIEKVIEKIKADEAVLAVILFGSRARGEELPGSDIDLCLVLAPTRDTRTDQMTARMAYLPDGSGRLDLRIFQQLPLYIRRRVLKEGTVLLCKDLDALYAIAYRTAQAFEDFKPIYRHYLDQVAHAGS